MAQLFPPLSDTEKVTQQVVCVTGASGYIAGHVVQRLLAAGHTVHATVRNPDKASSIAHLTAMEGSEKLKFFKADLLTPDSFDEAIEGCGVVIHTASPFFMAVPKGKEMEAMVNPAIQGTENVLGSVNKVKSVKRVVLTSSVVAIQQDPYFRGKDHVFTEQDWNEECQVKGSTYNYSKTKAEEKAWEIAKAQSRWSLVAINPGLVLGPSTSGRADGESVKIMKGVINGEFYAGPKLGFGIVDVRDVASAHCLVAFKPSAEGRHLLVCQSAWMKDLGTMLRTKYGQYPLMKYEVPTSILWLVSPLAGISRNFVTIYSGKIPHFDNTKSKQLGVSYTPLQTTVEDMAADLISKGIIKDRTPKK